MPQELNAYFAEESAEYLDRIDALLGAPGIPDPAELRRQARGIRGSARLAGADGVATAAERLEESARRLEDGGLSWDEEVRDGVRRSAVEIRTLIARHGNGGGGDAGDEVVSIRSLFFDDGGPHILSSDTAPLPGSSGEARDFVRRRAGSFLAEAEAALNSAGSRWESAMDRVVGAVVAVRELAGTYGLADFLQSADLAALNFRSAASAAEARAVLAGLRASLWEETGPQWEDVPAAAAVDQESGELVPIETLLYSGRDALREALSLRRTIERLLDDGAPVEALRPALDELFDLVELGLGARTE